MKNSVKKSTLVSVIALAAAAPSIALAGVIEGRVSDQSGDIALDGAIVRIAETGVSATTDRSGQYRIANVPAGTYTLVVSYVGAEEVSSSVSVPSANAVVEQNLSLGEDIALLDNILVVGQRGALNSSLSRQKASDKVITVLSADAIGQLPDENVAEAARRAVGVNVLNDQGEGRFVSIRGASPNFVTSTINGVRVPSPEADQRQVPLDVIDSDILSAITVTKTLTPDVDGDSTGGNIEIETLSGLDQKNMLLKLKAAGIYANQVEELGQRYSGVYANNFMDGKLGIAGSIAYQKREFGSENKEVDGPDWVLDESVIFPEELEFRDYQITRERLSASLNLDYQLTDAVTLYAHGLYSDFSDQEFRSRVENKFGDPDFDPANSSGTVAVFDGALDDPFEVDRDIKDRLEEQQIISVVTGVDYVEGPLEVDAAVSYSYAEEREPNRLDTGFRATFDSGLFGVDSADPILPRLAFPDAAAETAYFEATNYEFDGLELLNGVAEDDEFGFQANVKYDLDLFGAPGYLKSGVKIRAREKSYDVDVQVFDGFDPADLTLAQFATTVDFGLDRINPVPDAGLVRDFFFANQDGFELDDGDTFVNSTVEDYSASEDVFAGYVMGERTFNGNVSVVAGVRVEHTEYSASGFAVDEDAETFSRVAADMSYTDFLPSVNMRYEIQEDVIARLGYYKTLVRPNIEDAAPRTVIDEDDEGESGNPNLERQTVHNIDAALEWYPSNKSVLSIGAFYKDFSDFIAVEQLEDVTINTVFFSEVDTFINLPDASLFGIEANIQHPMDYLPGLLDGIIVSANYTFVDGDATLADGRGISIPGQSSHVATGILGYEKGPLDLRFAVTYRDEYLDEIGVASDLDDTDLDRFVDSHIQFDASAKYRVTDQFRVFAEFKNINNEAFVASIRPSGLGRLNAQFEEYSWTAKFGVAFTY